MKLVCTNCGAVAQEGTRWCQNREKNCPPGTLSLVFDPGETFDDLEIQGLLRLFQTAALYRARRGKESLLLKIAHSGDDDRLKHEAQLLAQSEPHPALPTLLSASTAEQRAYNKFTFQGEIKYYMVYQPVEGQFLRDRLVQNPYCFSPQQAAWLVIGLADVVAYLHVKHGQLLLNLNPDTILVRLDQQSVPRPLLLDLGTASAPNAVNPAWFKRSPAPAYLAPEQIRENVCTAATDVYALGLILYEMLAGQPAFPFKLRSDDDVRALVLSGDPVPLRQRRPELPQGIGNVVQQALQKSPANRQPEVRTLAKGLRVLVGEVPPEQRGVQVDRRVIAVVAFVALALLLIFILWLLTQP